MLMVLNRLKEPSTWAGIAPLLAGLGLFGLSEGFWQQAVLVLAGLAGVAAIGLSERGGK